LVLNDKLEQYINGHEVKPNPPTDFVIAEYLYQICTKYGKDIEFMVTTRMIIDDLFDKSQKVFSMQFLLFLIGFVGPFLLQIFIFEEVYQIQACLTACMVVMAIFSLYVMLQVKI
jgi:hypothetical protein